jgi:hypothetical protein
MKKRLIITLIALSVSLSGMAATCPPAEGLDLKRLPTGWNILVAPIFQGQTYHFGKATHSLNGSFYYQQVICQYQTCSSFGCPAFTIVSNGTFQYPESDAAPWDARPVIRPSLVCFPPNHDPSVCIFR